MNETVEIGYLGLELEVSGKYYKGEERTRDYPGSPSEFEVESVYIKGTEVEVSEFLDNLYEITSHGFMSRKYECALDVIMNLVIEKIEEL